MIINKLRQIPEFEKVRFVREFTTQYAETPVSGFLAAVIVKSTELTESYLGGDSFDGRGDLYTAEAEIRIYAPNSKNGSGLSALTGDMLAELRKIDCPGRISELKAGSVEYDQNLSAVFRRLCFKLEFFVSGEDHHE
jgi:hypothetical protein